MGDFVIYSMGDPDFMRLALLGLSHSFEQGALSLAKIGLMLGLLAVFWKGVWSPDKIEFKQFFIGFFLVYFLFAHQVPVKLVHSNGVGVDNMPPIPIGIALSATIATNFGYSMASGLREFYQTTYVPGSYATGTYRTMLGLQPPRPGSTPPTVAGNGLDPLRELMKLRYNESPGAFANSSNGEKVDYTDSIQNYIKDCVLKDEYLKNASTEVNTADFYNTHFAWEQMKVSYDGWSTSINVANGQGYKTVGCGTAYDQLDSVINSVYKNMSVKGGTAKSKVDDELTKHGTDMLHSVNGEAWKIKVNQLMHYHYKKSQSESVWSSKAQLMSSQSEFEAMDKRRVSTAVQYSLWSEMAIPLISYIEAFVFLIGPLMPLVIAFGEKGLGLVLKYFFILIWVNTWPVLQVGVNMYLQNAMNKTSFATSPYDPFSWAGYNTTFTELESFIAMGSTLQTMVPALSLMLLYGSAHTMINVANSAQKGGGSEGASASPTAAAPHHSGKGSTGQASGSFNQLTGQYEQGFTGGSNAMAGLKQFSTGNTVSSASSGGVQRSNENMEATANQVSSAYQEMAGMLELGSDGKSIVQSDSSNQSEGVAQVAGIANTLMKTGGLTQQEAIDTALLISSGAGGEVGAQLAAQYKLLGGKNASGITPLSAGLGLDVSAKADAKVAASAKSALSKLKNINESGSEGWSQEKKDTVQAQYAKVEQASKNAQTSTQNTWGETGVKMQQASKAYSNAVKQTESESRLNSQLANFQGANAFNFNSVTSDTPNNQSQERLASGEMAASAVRQTAFDNMSSAQKTQFNDYKKENGFGNTLNEDTKALQGFVNTEQGANLKGMLGDFKTQEQYQQDFNKAIGDPSNLSVSEYNHKAALFADSQFQTLANSSGSQRYQMSANYLDNMNDSLGGKVEQLATAAGDFRNADKIADKAFNIAPPESAGDNGLMTMDNIDSKRQQLKSDGESKKAEVEGDYGKFDAKKLHENAVAKQSLPVDEGKLAKSRVLSNQSIDTSELDTIGKKTTEARKNSGDILNAVADVGNAVVNTASNFLRDSASEQLEAKGVSSNHSDILSGNVANPHAQIVGTIAGGLKADSSYSDKLSAAKLLASTDHAEDVVKNLRGKGDDQSIKEANALEKGINSVKQTYSDTNATEGQKGLIQALSQNIKDGNISENGALGVVSPKNLDLQKLPERYEAMNGQKAVMETMEQNGHQNTPEYKKLAAAAAENEKYFSNKQGSTASLIAAQGYNKHYSSNSAGFGNHNSESQNVGNDRVAKRFMSDLFAGKDNARLDSDGYEGALNSKRANTAQELFSTGKEKNSLDSISTYEDVRAGLIAGARELSNTPGMEKYGKQLEGRIAELDKQTGYDKRETKMLSGEVGYSSSNKQEVTGVSMDAASSGKIEAAAAGQRFNFGNDTTFTKQPSDSGTVLQSNTGQSFALTRNDDGSGSLSPINTSNQNGPSNAGGSATNGTAGTLVSGTNTATSGTPVSGTNTATAGTPVSGGNTAAPVATQGDDSGAGEKQGTESGQTVQGQQNADVARTTNDVSNASPHDDKNTTNEDGRGKSLDSNFVVSTYGEGDRINVNSNSFNEMISSENGDKFNLAGESFTKQASSSGDMQTLTLTHDSTGDRYNLYQDAKTGEGNFTIEAVNRKF